MKRILFQVFNVVMAVVVLLSSTGFGLVEHSCQMRGKKKTMVVAFSDVKPPKSCTTHKKTPPTDQTRIERDKCCQDSQYYENVDVSSSLSQLAAKCIKAISQPIDTIAVTLLAWLTDWIYTETSASTPIFSPPLSLSGRDILKLAQCLLI
ncbi:hypothetical protein GCM10027592_19580 [Spirosoma flavus]